jgi:glycosyltransferase involved in cell wall biosynthesis
MKVTFVSNYINHHQLPFCKAMNSMEDVEFHFIQTEPMEEKRIAMGWGMDVSELPFVSLFYEDEDKCKRLILDSDVTILGWSDGIVADIEKERLSSGKLTFRVSERIYREGQWKFISPKGLMAKYNEHIRYRNKPVYLLCAGAYVASDFDVIRSYPGKKLKWGYFPEKANESYIKPELSECIKLCWAGRLIELKHSEYAIETARSLAEKGYNFRLDIVGDGNKRSDLEALISQYGLRDKVIMHGGKRPDEVLTYMQKADVFLFTSNYLEGWGAVVNEAMQCGCAVVASNEAGAVPFLIQDGVNGLSYDNGSLDAMQAKVLYLFENRDKIREFGKRAQESIEKWWNAENAARELIRFAKEYMNGNTPEPSTEGPMSLAPNLPPAGFIRSLHEKNRLE